MKRLFIIFLLMLSGNGFAVDYRQFSNPEQQEIYESLTSELRCLVCQNQTIADSNAELAADLRRQVYEMIEQGKTRQEILGFMTERYGDFVLYKPPFKAKTGILWIAPAIFLLTGLIAVFLFVRQKKKLSGIESSPEKQEKIRSLLENGDQS
ncbi:Cytochrome c-type biogenesis protein CcmH [Candidatus Methylobacter favarea]|uniref:Cytochrome c-type biogenesis protein n=1 Tax=Candidatus Methylobacter favarea TaxID=2707345 RepID=A0A8S0XFU6_9GAMM|nr:cytochrome c-type biogenesis protein [Candidatus Methylobacter favarea]CAA9890627.1 Cytochrome c-type biogenesis protein CcmH [Candidatus Methylobacter favarea]